MDNTTEIMPNIPVEMVSEPVFEAVGAEQVAEFSFGGSLDTFEPSESGFYAETIKFELEDQEGYIESGSGISSVEPKETDIESYDTEKKIEDARSELEEIQEEPRDEGEQGIDPYEQLGIMDATIAMLTIQRDSLKEQLGMGVWAIVGKMLKEFLVGTFNDKADQNEQKAVSSEAWKENARSQLRKVESQLEQLKEQRERFVANFIR